VSLGLGIVGTASPGSLALGRPQARLRPGQRFRRANAADFGPVWGGDHQQIPDSDIRPHHRMFGSAGMRWAGLASHDHLEHCQRPPANHTGSEPHRPGRAVARIGLREADGGAGALPRS
jgi:hypothetical protein